MLDIFEHFTNKIGDIGEEKVDRDWFRNYRDSQNPETHGSASGEVKYNSDAKDIERRDAGSTLLTARTKENDDYTT
jgi:hypothetical protein